MNDNQKSVFCLIYNPSDDRDIVGVYPSYKAAVKAAKADGFDEDKEDEYDGFVIKDTYYIEDEEEGNSNE